MWTSPSIIEAELTRSLCVDIRPIIHSEYNIQLDLGNSSPSFLLRENPHNIMDRSCSPEPSWCFRENRPETVPHPERCLAPRHQRPAVTPVTVIIKIFPLKIFLNSPWAVILTPMRITGPIPTQTPASLYTHIWPLFNAWTRGAHLLGVLA